MTLGEATHEAARLRRLAGISGTTGPVVSVYLNTRWADEHQRERVRLFLTSELRKARAPGIDPALASDLDWIEAQGRAVVERQLAPDAGGVALFACHAAGLRETVPVRNSFEPAFIVDEAAYLVPLAALLEEAPTGVVVFVDSQHARLVPLDAGGIGEELELRGDVPGHHRRGGWAQLAQSRYQRHIQAHRDQHFEAVVEAIGHLVDAGGARQLVLAGDPRIVGALRSHLPASLGGRVAGVVPAARHEPASALVSRAAAVLAAARATEAQAAVDAVLTEAAKGGRAAAGPEATIEAAGRGAIYRLYALRTFREAGRRCGACGGLQRGAASRCRLCGGETRAVELRDALVERVLSSGGEVEVVETHDALGGVGGVAARLRYPI
jgi:peptide chain release factor subunit 1